MRFPSLLLTMSAALALVLPSCVTAIPAQPGQAKLRAGPRDFNRPGPLILVEKVDGQKPKFDDNDYSAILAPGPHEVQLKPIAESGGEMFELMRRTFGPPPPPPPQTVHRFTAESGHDYLYRWALKSDGASEAIWIEDYNRGGAVVSGERSPSAPTMKDPFAK